MAERRRMTAAAGPVLRDIHLPPEPSWWPPAPGWWLLALLALALLAWGAWRWQARRRRARARAVLVREFETARREHPSNSAAAAQVAALSLLLRRAARHYAPHALSLRGEDWLAFLDADDVRRPFRDGPGRLLLDGPYRAQVDGAEADALALAVRARLDRFVTAHA
jgi:hypothetical protein